MAAVPGSMPRTITRRLAAPGREARRSTGDLGEELLWDVEVRGDALDVVELLERLDEAHVLARTIAVDLDGVLGNHRALRALDRHAGGVERPTDGLEPAGGRVDLDDLLVGRVDVLGARVDRRQRDVVGILAPGRDRDQ